MKSYKEDLLMIAKQILEDTEAADIDEIEINVDEEFGETVIRLRKQDDEGEYNDSSIDSPMIPTSASVC